MEELTLDPLFSGILKVWQPKEGYRFSVEALLLGAFVRLKRGECAAELGAGCGVISALVALRFPFVRIAAIEVQQVLAKALALTVRENELEHRVVALRADLKNPPLKEGSFSAVFFNPPFSPVGTGRLPPEESHLLARTEFLASLEDFLVASKRLLKEKGRVFLVQTALRTGEVFFLMKRLGLEPKRVRFVHSYPGQEAKFVLVEGVKGGGAECRIAPPLYIYERPSGPYSAELKRFFEDPMSSSL